MTTGGRSDGYDGEQEEQKRISSENCATTGRDGGGGILGKGTGWAIFREYENLRRARHIKRTVNSVYILYGVAVARAASAPSSCEEDVVVGVRRQRQGPPVDCDMDKIYMGRPAARGSREPGTCGGGGVE